jgi:hypothetical protein
VAIRGYDQDPGVAKLPGHELEEQEGGLVGPVDVVEHGDKRTVIRCTSQQSGHALEQPEPGLVGLEGGRLGEARDALSDLGNELS